MTRAADLAKLIAGGGSITVDDNSTNITLKSTDADANVGPLLDLNRDSGSPADSDFLGKIQFSADDDGGNKLNYAFIDSKILDASNGSEDGQIDISTVQGGSAISRLQFNTATVFNEDSADVDFRIESNGVASAFFVDAGADAVVIGESAAHATISGGTPAFQVSGEGFRGGSAIVRNDNGAFGPFLAFAKSRNSTPGSFTIVQDGDGCGGINFFADDGTNLDS